MNFSITVNGVTEIVARLQTFPVQFREKVYKAMVAIGFDLTGYIQQNKLSGQVLNQRTGWLSSHVHPETTQQGNTVITVVGIDSKAVPYAAHWEFGFTGTETVKAHFRTISQAFGKPISTRQILVNEFSRNVNDAPRSYMRSGLADRQDTYVEQLRQLAASEVRL